MQENHPHHSRVAQHALDLGSGFYAKPNPTVPAQFTDSTLQSDSTQESVKPKSPAWLLGPQLSRSKTSLRQWQHELKRLKEAQPDHCMKWVIFRKWSQSNQVDFTLSSTSPIKSIANFRLYLFQDRKLEPSTIDGYRSVLADKLGNLPINVSRDENLHSFPGLLPQRQTKGSQRHPILEPFSGT